MSKEVRIKYEYFFHLVTQITPHRYYISFYPDKFVPFFLAFLFLLFYTRKRQLYKFINAQQKGTKENCMKMKRKAIRWHPKRNNNPLLKLIEKCIYSFQAFLTFYYNLAVLCKHACNIIKSANSSSQVMLVLMLLIS